MNNSFLATYEHGTLKLDSPLSLPEQARVKGLVTIIEGQGEQEFGAASDIADDEFERLLGEFSLSGAIPLPPDFARADIYMDHN